MSIHDATRMHNRNAAWLSTGLVALWFIIITTQPCLAVEQAADSASIEPATCKPGIIPVFSTYFGLQCDKRIPSGIFLGSYLSQAADSIDDCVKRCAANDKCQAFSLDNRDPPANRVCTLFGSVEGYSDARGWVTGGRMVATSTSSGQSPAPHSHHHSHSYSQKHQKQRPSWAKVNIDNSGATIVLTPDMKALQPVYFATDRKRVYNAALDASFAGDRDPNMTYGRAIVSIPKHHELGTVKRPRWRLIRFKVEPETDADHFRLKHIAWLDRGTFVDQLKGGPGSVLLFVHGYNVTFADAIFKAAQIAYDANFDGSVLTFSWPSAGGLFKYDQDRESAEFAVPHLAQTFRLLSTEVGKKNIYIVAHSMGNQVLVNALLASALSKANLTITELVMAAPDVDKDVFGTKVDQIRSVAKNITLYASAADKALLASGTKSFGTRLGYVGRDGPAVFAGIDVIDVTAVGDDMLGLGHGTFSGSRAVLDDLGRLIRSLTHLPPDLRTPTLKFMPDKANVKYWLYPP